MWGWVATVWTFLMLCGLEAVVALNAQPNILFLVADDLGATDVGWRGSEFPTPNIDRLAYGGIRLENYYVQLVCSPSRTSFLTGRYPLHTGLQHIVIWQDVVAAIDHEHPTIAEVLRDEFGYRTSYAVGKWHAGHAAWNNTPGARGFEGGWYGWNGGSSDYYEHVIGAQAPNATFKGTGYAMFDGLGPRAGVPDPVHRPEVLPIPSWVEQGNYSTELWADQAIELIQAHNFSADPFFMYLAFQSPHAPVQPCPDEEINAACRLLTTGEGRDVFCSMVTYMDKKIGEVVHALQERSQFDNTLIIMTSDNGGCMPAENRGCNWPMRGGKHHLFEGGVKVTGFLGGGALPENVRGSTSHALMHATDWLPTIVGFLQDHKDEYRKLSAAAVSPSELDQNQLLNAGGAGDSVISELDIDGVNLWPALTNVSNLNTSSINPNITYSPRFEIPHNVDPLLAASPTQPQGAIRLGTFKLIVGDLDVGWLHCNMTLEKPTPAQSSQGALNNTFMLFDLLNDPNERHDLSSSPEPEHQAALQQLLQRWSFWKSETVPPIYPDSDPASYPTNFKGVYNGSWMPWVAPTGQ